MRFNSGARLGPYEVLGPLGSGGMGEVYRARDPRLGRDVAIKIISVDGPPDPDQLRRFDQEARILAALSNPYILEIYDVGTHDQTAYVVFELLQGETLRSRLDRKALSIAQVVDLGVQVCRGLAAAHEKGVVHRDLKPANVFLTKEGRVKILDFGLAKLRSDSPIRDREGCSEPTKTDSVPGQVLGTAGYMSPEQVRGQPADGRSDIFSFGAIFYEMLTRRKAFQRDTNAETIAAVLREEPTASDPFWATLPPLLSGIVTRCLAKQPANRFHSAHDLAFALEAWDAALPGRVSRHRVGPWIAGLATTLAALAIGVFWARGVDPPLYRRLTFQRGRVEAARFTPDGQGVVYAATFEGRPLELFETRLDGRESRSRGLPGSTLFAISSQGEMALQLGEVDRTSGQAILAGGMLARLPLTSQSPRSILENVIAADWSPDGQELAAVVEPQVAMHASGSADPPDLGQRVEYPLGTVLYRPSGQVPGIPNRLLHMRVSPRGDRVAFIEAGVELGADQRILTVDRKGVSRVLSNGWTEAWGLAWAPNGGEVWFTAARAGSNKCLYAVSLAGHVRLLARVSGEMDLQDVSRERRVLFEHPSLHRELYVHSLVDGTTKELTWLGNSLPVAFSSDGHRLLFNDGVAGGGTDSFFVRDIPGLRVTKLGEGQAFAFSRDDRFVLATDSQTHKYRLVPTESGTERTINDVQRFQFCSFAEDNALRCMETLSQPGGAPVSRTFRGRVAGGPWEEVINKLGPSSQPTAPFIEKTDTNGGRSPEIEFMVRHRCLSFAAIEPGKRWACVSFESDRARVFDRDLTTQSETLIGEWVQVPSSSEGVLVVEPGPLSPDGHRVAYSIFRKTSDLYVAEGIR